MRKKRTLLIMAALSSVGIATGVVRGLSGNSLFYWILICLCLCACAALGYLMGSAPTPRIREGSVFFKTSQVIAALLLMLVSIMEAVTLSRAGTLDLLGWVITAFGIVTGVCMVLCAAEKDLQLSGIMVSAPMGFVMVLILQLYKQYAAFEPDRSVYMTEIIGGCIMMLSVYSVAAMRFKKISRSFLITTPILCNLVITLSLLTTALITGGKAPSILSVPQLGIFASFALYSASWYLEPPIAHPGEEEPVESSDPQISSTEETDESDPSFYDAVSDREAVNNSLNKIIDDIKSIDDEDEGKTL